MSNMTPSEIADWLDKRAYFSSGEPRYGTAAAMIRAQAVALKIATEALEVIKVNTCEAITKHDATQALARIKEVG